MQAIDPILNNKHVLIVEDEVLVAMGLIGVLEDFGVMPVGPAATLEGAFRILESYATIDAAVLDVNLAGDEVFPFADALQTRSIPFVFHTGHETKISLEHRYPDALVYLKPCMPERILEGLSTQLVAASLAP